MNFKNILIFRTGSLGDTLVSLPAFWAVRKAASDARLTLLSNGVEPNSKQVLAQSILPEEGLFDDWIIYPANQGKFKTVRALTNLFLKIKQRKFDLLIYLMNRNRDRKSIQRDKLFFQLSGIRKSVGTEYLLNNLLSYEQAKPLPTVESEIDFFVNCLKYENFPVFDSNPKPEMLLNEREKSFSENWLEQNCQDIHKNNILVGIAPGSKWQSKLWDENRYFQVIKRLIAEKNIFPIIFGGIEDREIGNRLIDKLGRGANAAGDLNIRRAAAVLAKCQLYLGNDSGTMHLAASVGTRCVAVFAAIDFNGRWHPFGNNHHILRKQVECEGCHSPISLNDNRCLKLIEVEEVYQSCLKVLDENDE